MAQPGALSFDHHPSFIAIGNVAHCKERARFSD
jgi:hypothetical protein